MAIVMTKTSTMHDTSHDLGLEIRKQMVSLCNQQLANTADLYAQTKQAHWNVKGIYFEQFHVLFDKMADGVLPYADMIAERVTALGGTAMGTVRMAGENSELPEFPADVFDGEAMIKIVVERWAQYAAGVRSAITLATDAGDDATADLFTEISRETDKLLWFAEAHLQA